MNSHVGFQKTFSINELTHRQSDSHKNSNIEFNILTNTMTISDDLWIECDWFHFICICGFVYFCIDTRIFQFCCDIMIKQHNAVGATDL